MGERRIGVRFLAGARKFSLLYNVHRGSESYPASYPMGTGVDSAGVKRLRREADHSPPSSAEVKNGGSIPPLPHTSSWRGASLLIPGITLSVTYMLLPLA
jgi:hypothetical protein